jgi:hypothetical protein
MRKLLCFLIGHNDHGQHISYRGLIYQFRCRRCSKLITRSW